MTLRSEFDFHQWLSLAIAVVGLVLPFWARRLPLPSRGVAWMPWLSPLILFVGFIIASVRMIPVFKATGAVPEEQKLATFEQAFEAAAVRPVLVTSALVAIAVLAFSIRYFVRHRVATDHQTPSRQNVGSTERNLI